MTELNSWSDDWTQFGFGLATELLFKNGNSKDVTLDVVGHLMRAILLLHWYESSLSFEHNMCFCLRWYVNVAAVVSLGTWTPSTGANDLY